MNAIAAPAGGFNASPDDPALDCGGAAVTDALPGRQDAIRAPLATAGVVAAVSGIGAGSALAGLVTVTTTQESGTAMQSGSSTASFDVLFTPIQSATNLVSISSGSVYTGEGATLTIQAIDSNDTTVTLFNSGIMPFFQNQPLSAITNNTFTDFSAREIKGLRFTLSQPPPAFKPSLTLPLGTDFVIATVPEPGAGVLLACSLAAVLMSRGFTRFVPVRRGR